MKRTNVFSIDLDKEDLQLDCQELVVRRKNENLKQTQDALVKEYLALSNRSVQYMVIRLLITVCFSALGICLLFTTFENFLDGNDLSVLLLTLSIVLLTVAVIMLVINSRIKKRKYSSEKAEELDKKLEEINKLIEKELGVPENAKEVEIFTYTYTSDKGDTEIDIAYLFDEGDDLCLYYEGEVVAIKKSSVEGIVKINEEICFDIWIKDEAYDSEKYAPYQIVKSNDPHAEKSYSMKEYYSIRFSQSGKEYDLLVPPYDIAPFTEILAMSPAK